MPVIFEKQIDAAKKLAVWQINESGPELFNAIHYKANPAFNEKRNIEQAVSKLIFNHMMGYTAHPSLEKDHFGKPYMKDSGIALSFSHSQNMVACIVDTEGNPVGIDIENIRERIQLISHKFCTEDDFSPFEGIIHQHLIWGGKEVLYKIYAKKNLDFKTDMRVQFSDTKGLGVILKDPHHSQHQLYHDTIDNFMLVWGY
ncbi:MAG: hypothetical protein V4613_12345 [Bacteroidota bacterium]